MDISIQDLPVYRGKFSWDFQEFQDYIRAVNEQYDKNDPQTWPLITENIIKEHDGTEYDGKTSLPPRVAYERSLVKKFTDQNPVLPCHASRVTQGIARTVRFRFYNFPFQYDSLDNYLENDSLTTKEYENWTYGVTGCTHSPRNPEIFAHLNVSREPDRRTKRNFRRDNAKRKQKKRSKGFRSTSGFRKRNRMMATQSGLTKSGNRVKGSTEENQIQQRELVFVPLEGIWLYDVAQKALETPTNVVEGELRKHEHEDDSVKSGEGGRDSQTSVLRPQ